MTIESETFLAEQGDVVLEHYGVKGQKWGIRREIAGLGNFRDGSVVTTAGKAANNDATDQEHQLTANATASTMSKLMCSPTQGLMRPNGPGMKLSLQMAKKYGEQKNAPKEVVADYERQMTKIAEKEAQRLAPKGAHARVVQLKRNNDLILVLGSKDLVNNLADDFLIKHAELPSQVTLRYERDANGWISGLQEVEDSLAHFGVKGMKWGVRRDERLLGEKDKALNLSQRSQVKLASSISALAAIGITSNAAATAFQLQSRWEHLQIVKAVMEQAENNPFLNDAGREALRLTKNKVVKGLVASAVMTTAVSAAIGIVTHRTAKAYFAPLHKTYGDVKPKINSDLKKLSKDIKSGKRAKLTSKQYYAEASKIVEKHMTDNKSNVLKPFHELARSQLGLEYNTKALDIKFQKLPNTPLYSKMTVTTPQGLKLVKAIKNVEHSSLAADGSFQDLDFYFDYKFDSEGYISEFSCPTIEIAEDMLDDKFDMELITAKFGGQSPIEHSDKGGTMTQEVETFLAENTGAELAHVGIKGMRWGIRRSDAQIARAGKVASAEGRVASDGERAAAAAKQLKKGGVQALSNDDIQALTTRLRLETSLAQAKSDQTGVFTKIDKKTKKLLGFGATANTAIAFAVSPTGRLLLQKFAPNKANKTLVKLALAGAGGNKLREDLGLIEPKDKKKDK